MSACYISTIALFIIDVFQFDELQLGYFMFVVGLFLAINQAFLSKMFIKRFGEFNTLIIGFGLTTIGLFGITLTQNIYVYCAIYYVLNLGVSLCFPTFNSLLAIHSEQEKQGEVMGINESLYSMCMAAFPILAAYLYTLIGFKLYYIISLLPLVGLVVAILSLKKLCKKEVFKTATTPC
jgi:MFS family permease